MFKISYKTLAIIIIAIIGFISMLQFTSFSNTWVCREGSWVKQGNPSKPPPNKPCYP